MDETTKDAPDAQPSRPAAATGSPIGPSTVPPPPMIVVHKGWFRNWVKERPMEELAEENRQRWERESRR